MKYFLTASLALAILCGSALAQREDADAARRTERPEQLDRALKERYGGNATVQIVGRPTEVNGVKLYNVKVTSKRGDSTAMVTEYGDFLISGMPSQFKGMPRAVQSTRTLFKANPENAEQFLADGYYIDVRGDDKRPYRMRYDAVGRLREVISPEDVERFETKNFKKADEGAADKVRDLAERHVPEGSKLGDVYIDPRLEGFYAAKYADPKGKEVLVILDDQGNIFQTRTEIEPDALTKAIRDSFNQTFDQNKMQYAYRTQYQYYQFDQQTPDGDRMTFKVRPNGEIMSVQSVKADQEEQAVTARFREGEGRQSTEVGPRR